MGETMDKRNNGEFLPTYPLTSVLPHAAAGLMEAMDNTAFHVRDALPTEIRREGLVTQLQRHCEDLRTILNQLQLGIIMTDEGGCIAFLNLAAQHLCGTTQEEVIGRPWAEVIPCPKDDVSLLRAATTCPTPLRTRVSVSPEGLGGQRYKIAVDVLDDPRHQQRKIFLLADAAEEAPQCYPRYVGRQFPDLIG
jgi:PAS domain S-box-containing protein